MPSRLLRPDDFTSSPGLLAVLDAIATVVRPAVIEQQGPDSCITTVRASLEVFRAFGVHARPLPVMLSVRNAAHLARARQEGRQPRGRWEVERWYRESGAHSIGLTGWRDGGRAHPAGHLVLLVSGAMLVDPSIDQIARPQHAITPPNLGAGMTTELFRRGLGTCTFSWPGAEGEYRAYPKYRAFERSPRWERTLTKSIVERAIQAARLDVMLHLACAA